MAYAAKADLLNIGFPPQALGTLTDPQINAALQAASDFADTFFRGRYGDQSVPFLAWDTSVTDAVAQIAALRLLRVRGYAPDSTADQRFQKGRDEAVEWLNSVQRQESTPVVTLATNATMFKNPTFSTASVISLASGRTAPTRGW
jgi:phage gp36-like protein